MTARGVDRRIVGGGCAVGAAVFTICVVLDEHVPVLGLIRLALIPLAAAAAFVLDEPAAAAVDAVPRSRRRRTSDRVVAVVLPVGVWGAGVVAVELRAPGTPAVGLLVEGTGVLAVAVALAAVVRWFGKSEPGEAVASVVGATMVALLAFDLPSWWPVPLFPGDTGWPESTVLWSGLTVTAVLLLHVVSADPYRSRF